MTGRIPAVILAGGKANPEMARAAGVSNRALIPVRGRPMLDLVVDALQGSGVIGGITVVGNVPESDSYQARPDAGGFVENLFQGLDPAGAADWALIATADLPFLTADAVRDMVTRGFELEADVVYPIVAVADCYARFPGMRRTAVKLKDGEFTGGNLMLVRPAFARSHREVVARAYAARKSPLAIARLLGFGAVARAAVALTVWPNALSVEQLERAASRMLEGRARALVSRYPEIATDVDRPEDLEALAVLAGPDDVGAPREGG